VLQLKYGVNEVSIQLSPGGAGKMDNPHPSQDEIIARAASVFAQETGYTGGEWSPLGSINIDDNKYRGPSGEGPLRAHLLMATDVVRTGRPQPRSTDFYEVVTIPPSEFPALLRSPYLAEASAVACLLRAFVALGRLQWT
jgi:hypothetical protein